MAMFGASRPDPVQPFPTSLPLAPIQPPLDAPQLNLPPPRPGFNDVGGLGDDLRTLAGHLLAIGGQPEAAQTYLAPIEQRAAEQRMFGRQANQQALEFARQAALAQMKPPELPGVAKNYQWIESNFPGRGAGYLDAFVQNGGAQGPATINVNGQTMMRAPGAPASAAIHPDAIARLRAHPDEASLFDQQFGAGSAAQYLGTGGAASGAPIPFPR